MGHQRCRTLRKTSACDRVRLLSDPTQIVSSLLLSIKPENTHWWGKDHCAAGLQFYKVALDCFTEYQSYSDPSPNGECSLIKPSHPRCIGWIMTWNGFYLQGEVDLTKPDETLVTALKTSIENGYLCKWHKLIAFSVIEFRNQRSSEANFKDTFYNMIFWLLRDVKKVGFK